MKLFTVILICLYMLGCSSRVSRPIAFGEDLGPEFAEQITQWSLEDIQVVFLDHKYNLMSKAELQTIVDRLDISNNRYKKTIFDCDDFAFLLKAEMAKYCGYNETLSYPIPIMVVIGVVTVKGQTFGHAWNAVIDDNYKVWFIEPQTGQFIDPKRMNIQQIYLIIG